MSISVVQGESRVVLTNIRWATFEAVLAENDRRNTRFTFDRGVLEIMSPSREHERLKRLLGRMIETMTLELNIPISSGGSTTLKDQFKERGVEPDECYYVAHERLVRGRDNLDLSVDPPPDLAIEVDISASSMDQLSIYADLGVPEVWLCDGTSIDVSVLQPGGKYAQCEQSAAFPLLPIDQVQRFLNRRASEDETTLLRTFRDWVVKLCRGQ